MATCLIGLGSNLGDRAAALDRALERIGRHSQVVVAAASRRCNTTAVGGPPGQGDYLNAAARLQTTLTPRQLLALLLRTERELGRQPGPRWAARIIDLDLLLYDELQRSSPTLELPHPRMAFRRFVLAPASEVAPEMVHPATGWTIRRLLHHLDTAVDYVAVAGPPGAGKTALAGAVAAGAPARLIAGAVNRCHPPQPRDNPPGQTSVAEIELLLRRAQLLRELPASRDVESPLSVSDFWLDQSLVYAQLSLAGAQLAQFENIWRETRLSLARPKLLVLLDAPAKLLAKRILPGGSAAETARLRQRLEQVRVGLRERCRQKDQGPVLLLDAGQPDRALAEVIAAAQAMR